MKSPLSIFPSAARTSFHLPSPPRPRNNFSVVAFYRNKFVPHFLTGMSQIHHLAFASKLFHLHYLIPKRILGWAGIGARPNLERSLLLRAGTRGRLAGRLARKPEGGTRHRLDPNSERPFPFCSLEASLASPCFYCHRFLNTPKVIASCAPLSGPPRALP